tara:strand:+ start:645 stop:3290 length:2646 start_codon:yes stop_codon:yes gene_type:complete
LASNSASASSDDIELVITFDEPTSDPLWYYGNETLLIDIKIYNSGSDTQSVEYNPSCPVEIEMVDFNGEIFSNLQDHRACQQQLRAIDIPAGQTRNLDSFEWNWENNIGETINGGLVTINFNFDNGLIVNSQTIEFQHVPVSIEGLLLEVNTAPPPGDRTEFFDGEKIYSHISLRNINDGPVFIDVDSGCRVTLQANSIESELPLKMTDLGCGEGIIGVGESLPLGWLDWDFNEAGETPAPGIWNLDVGLTGIYGLSSTIFATLNGNNQQAISTPLNLEINILGDEGGDGLITDSDVIKITTNMVNYQNIPAEMEFNSSCLVAIHLISEKGNIVGDTRSADACENEHTEMKVSATTTYQLDHRDWFMVDQSGCELNDGSYLMVIYVPEYNLFREYEFTYDGTDSGLECHASMQDPSLGQLRVIDLVTNDAGTNQESVTFQLRLESQLDLDIYWPQDCQLEFELQKVGASQPQQIWLEECAAGGGDMGTISSGNGIDYGPYTVQFTELNAGSWGLTVRTTGTPSFSTQWAHTWNPQNELVVKENSTDESVTTDNEFQENNENVTVISWMSEGHWEYITTESGGCWILIDLDGVEHAYTSTSVDNWVPRTNHRGAYWVEQTVESTIACSFCQSHIIVKDVLGEVFVEPVIVSEVVEVEQESAPIISVPAAAPAIVTIIASTSLLAIIASALVQVEWIRLPATKYGLFLLGMVRKNKEKGGEYQRGRIVAYIELHRGIHFRALLGALDMSNGQLTHHLSVLEGDETIWRRKDGRKVRYYPASIDSSASNDDLPVPVLTPDPNSLQGRILQILDIHENEILNLSQKELSDKLETSQQLVSYHLKSLENWGLVEKERVALRYRYRLTDRALILLNTTELPSLRDDA